MIFSVRRSQYCISHSKCQRLFVTRHWLSCEKVNLHKKLVTWACDTCDFTSYSTRFVSSNTISPQITFHLSHSISAQLNLYETLNFINQSCIYRNQNFSSSSSLRTTLPMWFTWIWTSYPTCRCKLQSRACYSDCNWKTACNRIPHGSLSNSTCFIHTRIQCILTPRSLPEVTDWKSNGAVNFIHCERVSRKSR